MCRNMLMKYLFIFINHLPINSLMILDVARLVILCSYFDNIKE